MSLGLLVLHRPRSPDSGPEMRSASSLFRRHVCKVNKRIVFENSEVGFYQAVYLFHAPRELHHLPRAPYHPYAKLVLSFCAIAAGGLDLNATE
jgi:hypothetical protein